MRNTKTDLAKLFKAFENGTPLVYREVDLVAKRMTLRRCIINRIEFLNDAIDFIRGTDVEGNGVVFSDSIQMRPYMNESAIKIVPLDGILFSADEYISKKTLIKG